MLPFVENSIPIMPDAFDLNAFALKLLADALFYDPEQGTLGHLSLIDPATETERFLASFDADNAVYVIEEATDWEPELPSDDAGLRYRFAVDATLFDTYATVADAAQTLLTLARTHHLEPSFLLLYEDEE
jgi:hypothetical protein